MNIIENRPVIAWLFTGCFLIFSMVIIGGITRLTQSGLSMVEWKFTGSLPPSTAQEWNTRFEKYRKSPEARLINKNFTVEDFKHIFWWEYIHRFLGRAIGIVFILPFLWFWIRKKIPPGFYGKIILLFGLGLSQGILGWIMVKSGLNKIPHVSHFLLAAHLATAFTTFGFTFWFALELLFPVKEIRKSRSFNREVRILFFLVSLQIIYGAFVAGLKAGLIFSTFPRMEDHWVAPEVFSRDSWWENMISNPAGVQFIHRVLALLIVAMVAHICFRARKLCFSAQLKKILIALCAAITLQFSLGVTTLLFQVPVVIASMHQAGAFLLFSITLLLLHRLPRVIKFV